MRTRFDQLAKGVLARLLGPVGEVQPQYEIPGEVQAADIWFRPAPAREVERARLGLVGRMAATPCLIEPFHATPTAGEVLDCLSKQLTLRRALQREAARPGGRGRRPRPRPWHGGRSRGHRGTGDRRIGGHGPGDHAPLLVEGPRRPEVPRLWILSAGRPERVIQGLGLVPMEDDWPDGFWQAPALLRTCLVVLRDLPQTRETLLLRLLGAGATFRRAVHELHGLPRDAWEAELVIPQLLAFRVAFSHDSREDEMTYADELQTIYEEWRREVRSEGRQEGRLQMVRDGLATVYEARFGTLPPALKAAIESVEEESTLRQWLAPFATRTPDEIAALVRVGI